MYFLGNVVFTELAKKLPVLIHYHVHKILDWSQVNPIQTSTFYFIVPICTNQSLLRATGGYNIIHFYVCEVRQSCTHTVKSGEDEAGVV
jgi:hypothetical protein